MFIIAIIKPSAHRTSYKARFLSFSQFTFPFSAMEIRFILRVKRVHENKKNKSNILNMQFTLWRLSRLAWARLHIKLVFSFSALPPFYIWVSCVCVCRFVIWILLGRFVSDKLNRFEEAACFNFFYTFFHFFRCSHITRWNQHIENIDYKYEKKIANQFFFVTHLFWT